MTLTMPPNSTPLPSDRRFQFSALHLKHAGTHKLPCSYIKFTNNRAQRQIPSVMNVARWIRQPVQQVTVQSIGEFSVHIVR